MEIQTVLISILLSLLFLNPSFTIADKALIEQTCKKTSYPADCIASLESDARSSTADLTGLAKISLEISSSKVNETYAEVSRWVGNAPDYPTWSMYLTCKDFYNVSVVDSVSGLQAFNEKKYDVAYKKVSNVNDAATQCSNFRLATIASINERVIKFTNDTLTILQLFF